MSRRRPSFYGLFTKHVRIGHWITGRELARRIQSVDGKVLSEPALSPFAKECSQRLSNLERYGHVLRRFNPSSNAFEYARKETPEVKRSTWFPSDPNCESIE